MDDPYDDYYRRRGFIGCRDYRLRIKVRRGIVMDSHQRFWSLVIVGHPDACWPWSGQVNVGGYGRFMTGGKWYMAHRWALAWRIGTIPDGTVACHRCDNPRCCNPNHLYAGSHSDNMRESVERKRRGPKGKERIEAWKRYLRHTRYTRVVGTKKPMSILVWGEVPQEHHFGIVKDSA